MLDTNNLSLKHASALTELKKAKLAVHDRFQSRHKFSWMKEWLVKWHGLPEHGRTWELESKIKRVSHWRQLLQDFRIRQREVSRGGML
ncbi:TPA: hypothetical protein N0F65_006715 [Lagenidium giganteum]|uniref:Chromo domain-containing protein n=1 Tax=Lagenidium giganteum TaxID=4803 RepID=A0AAV2Z8K5_9STRA|nr:TPA: hypothetical protein N0F65_006715 [Lagenidium giganteum]